MENIMDFIGKALPWGLLIVLVYFTLVIISSIYGIFKAKKTDESLQLALNKKGKIILGILYIIYLIVLTGTIIMEIQILSSDSLSSDQKMYAALNTPNLLTVISLIAAIEFQDIFFIGKKNILIANRMFEIRRMRKMSFPKKNQMMFIYGQKQYTYSVRFVNIQMLKAKFTKLR